MHRVVRGDLARFLDDGSPGSGNSTALFPLRCLMCLQSLAPVLQSILDWGKTIPAPMRLWRDPMDHDKVAAPRGVPRFETAWCKGCKFCVEYCPRDVLVLSSMFNKKGYHYPEVAKPDECVDCKLCERLCPEFAIVVVTEDRSPKSRAKSKSKSRVAKPSKVAAS